MKTIEAANPAIITTYRGPTDTRGSRIVVTGGYRPTRMTVPYDQSLSATENHRAAAAAFIERRHGGPWSAVASADIRPGRMAHILLPDAT
ncbi:MAG: hypothetical protein EBR82_59480 [Caulobacteraceae bacterium]|nr:hypothetical protein [Caulobacteraceae bacterium]